MIDFTLDTDYKNYRIIYLCTNKKSWYIHESRTPSCSDQGRAAVKKLKIKDLKEFDFSSCGFKETC